MKYTISSFLIILFIGLSISNGYCDTKLVEGNGYGPIILNVSTLYDLRNKLGPEDEVQRTKIESSKNYIYRNLGLKFNIKSDGFVYSIITRTNFKGSTSKGIDLKSSPYDIEKAYGENPLVHPRLTKETSNTWNYPELGVFIWFRKDLLLKGKRKIQKIVISSPFKRPSKNKILKNI